MWVRVVGWIMCCLDLDRTNDLSTNLWTMASNWTPRECEREGIVEREREVGWREGERGMKATRIFNTVWNEIGQLEIFIKCRSFEF